LAMAGTAAADEWQDEVFQQMDANKDGIVDRYEYMYGTRDALDAQGNQEKEHRTAAFEYLSDLYDRADIDGDGVLSLQEVGFGEYLSGKESIAVLRGLPLSPAKMEERAQEARAKHMKLDENGDRLVDAAEFANEWRRNFARRGWTEASMESGMFTSWSEAVFSQADVNGDGGLSWKELQFAGFLVVEMTARQLVGTLFAGFDADGDGKIGRREIDALVAWGAVAMESAQRVYDNFDAVDADGDDVLNRQEVRKLASRLLNS